MALNRTSGTACRDWIVRGTGPSGGAVTGGDGPLWLLLAGMNLLGFALAPLAVRSGASWGRVSEPVITGVLVSLAAAGSARLAAAAPEGILETVTFLALTADAAGAGVVLAQPLRDRARMAEGQPRRGRRHAMLSAIPETLLVAAVSSVVGFERIVASPDLTRFAGCLAFAWLSLDAVAVIGLSLIPLACRNGASWPRVAPAAACGAARHDRLTLQAIMPPSRPPRRDA